MANIIILWTLTLILPVPLLSLYPPVQPKQYEKVLNILLSSPGWKNLSDIRIVTRYRHILFADMKISTPSSDSSSDEDDFNNQAKHAGYFFFCKYSQIMVGSSMFIRHMIDDCEHIKLKENDLKECLKEVDKFIYKWKTDILPLVLDGIFQIRRFSELYDKHLINEFHQFNINHENFEKNIPLELENVYDYIDYVMTPLTGMANNVLILNCQLDINGLPLLEKLEKEHQEAIANKQAVYFYQTISKKAQDYYDYSNTVLKELSEAFSQISTSE